MLPVFYVLDSICKNVGPSYARLFQRNITKTFLTAYEKASSDDRVKLFRVFKTWRGPPMLFSRDNLDLIESSLPKQDLDFVKGASQYASNISEAALAHQRNLASHPRMSPAVKSASIGTTPLIGPGGILPAGKSDKDLLEEEVLRLQEKVSKALKVNPTHPTMLQYHGALIQVWNSVFLYVYIN